MLRSPLSAVVIAAEVLMLPLPPANALAPAEAVKSFELADPALSIELVASEPMIESPCAFAFDETGRLYVAENRGYPNTSSPPQGRIALLKDTNGDGRMDERATFADGLTFPNGVLPWRGGVIVTCAPDVLFLKDTDGDGKADERRVLLTGFAITGSTQLRVNAPTLGPDGWIYLAAGLSGGMITAPAHPERPALKMTADVRFNPDTLDVEHVDGRSQYGMSFDDFGRRFICMNRLPVQHVVLASRWLRRNPHLAFSDTVQDCHEKDVKSGLRGGGYGVRLHPISSNVTTADSHAGSFSAACGVLIWGGGALGPAYAGKVFSCDPTGNLVHADLLEPRGPTFAAMPMFGGREFLASRDDSFRPVYLGSGPDGALYIADMYRPIIEHPDYLPQKMRKRVDFETGKAMGRIWRVFASAAVERGKPAIVKDPVKALGHEHAWQRQTAFRLLRETPAASAALRGTFGHTPPAGTSAILHLLAMHGELDAEALQFGANGGDFNTREVVLDLWMKMKSPRVWSPDPAVLGNESDARSRFVAALALGEIPEGTAALAAIAAKDRSDRWTRAAVLSSIGGRAEEFIKAFVESVEIVDSGAIEILRGAARSFTNVAELRRAIEPGLRVSSGNPASFAMPAALLAGVAERSGEKLEAKPGDEWLNTVLDRAVQLAMESNPATAPMADERALSIQLLSRMTWPKAGAPLLHVATLAKDEALRASALRAVAIFPEPEVGKTLLAAGAWARATPNQRELLLDALLSRPVHIASVLEAAEEGRLPANAIPTNRRAALLKSADKTLKARAEALFGKVAGDRQEAFEASKAALTLTPRPTHGREVFQQYCATCHRLDRAGHAVGPDLFDIRNQTKENILFHILVPDAEIAPAFAAYTAETTDGRVMSGVLASETPTSISLRGPLAQETSLLRGELKTLEALPNSLMPAGLEQAMSLQDQADLLAYLKGE